MKQKSGLMASLLVLSFNFRKENKTFRELSDLWIRISILGGVQQNLGSGLLSALPVPVPVPRTPAGPVAAAVAHRVTSKPTHAPGQTDGAER